MFRVIGGLTSMRDDSAQRRGSHPGLADFIEEDFAYCLSAGAIPGP